MIKDLYNHNKILKDSFSEYFDPSASLPGFEGGGGEAHWPSG